MLKALLRKQLLEVREVYLTGRKGKDGKKKKLKKSKGLYALFIMAVAAPAWLGVRLRKEG